MTAGLVVSSPALPFQCSNCWHHGLVDNKSDKQDPANGCAAAEWKHVVGSSKSTISLAVQHWDVISYTRCYRSHRACGRGRAADLHLEGREVEDARERQADPQESFERHLVAKQQAPAAQDHHRLDVAHDCTEGALPSQHPLTHHAFNVRLPRQAAQAL